MNRLWFKWFGVKVNAYGRNMIWAVLMDDNPSVAGDVYIIWGPPDRLRTKLYASYGKPRMKMTWPIGPGIHERILSTEEKNYKRISTQDEIDLMFPGLFESIEMDFTVRKLQQ